MCFVKKILGCVKYSFREKNFANVSRNFEKGVFWGTSNNSQISLIEIV